MSGIGSADLEILSCTDEEVRDVVNLTLFSLNAHSGPRNRKLPSQVDNGRVTLKELLKEIGQNSKEAHLEFSRKRIPDGFRARLQRVVNHCLTDADKAYLFKKIPHVRSEKFEQEAAILRSFGADIQSFQSIVNVGQISEFCTPHETGRLQSFGRPIDFDGSNDNGKPFRERTSTTRRDRNFKHGYYVLFTAETVGDEVIGYRLSAMEVLCERPFKSHPKRYALPIFKTERYDMPTEAVVDGVMMQPGDSVYTLGQIRGRRILRVSKLNFLHRPEKPGRFDLYGLRLAHRNQMPSCHRIFAYQIVRDHRIGNAIELMRDQAKDEKRKGVFDESIFEALSIDKAVERRISNYLCAKNTNSFDLDVPAII